MPNYLEYQKSIGLEFKARENRVRYLIDNANWAEEGRYKEIILMNYLKQILPKNISVGTGFIRNGQDISTQIDIIIYDNSYPTLFCEGDFVVVTATCVYGIIEVKSRITSATLPEIMRKANMNGNLIFKNSTDCCFKNRSMLFFNGIFSYNITNKFDTYQESIKQLAPYTIKNDNVLDNSFVNHICLGEDNFIRYWKECEGFRQNKGNYSFYSFSEQNKGLSFSYFFSNLLQQLYSSGNHWYRNITSELYDFLFPIDGGKEIHNVGNVFMGTNPGNDII